jgi:hypothetical protein
MQRMIGRHCAQIWGELPRPAHKALLCLGAAPCGVEQTQAFLAHTAADVAACNDAIVTYPGPLFVAASLHVKLLSGWLKDRTAMNGRPCVVGSDFVAGVDVVVGFNRAVGSSGMYLALLGGLMGYGRIVLAGILLEREGEEPYRKIWRAAKDEGALRHVESLSSGWLGDLLRT